jgi:Carboxypeptidase regulatory-like domain/TonB-dependent Receptor Plug Domain
MMSKPESKREPGSCRTNDLRHRLHVLLGSLLLLAVCALPVRAQILVGHVVAEDTKEPVHHAEISVIDGDGTKTRVTATTDSAGDFQLRAPGPGTYTVRVTHIAFVEFTTRSIELERGETLELEIRLGRNVIPLEPLIVTARSEDLRLKEFHERLEKNAFGKFITREEIDRYPLSQVSDLFRVMAGVRVVPINGSTRSLITMRGGIGQCLPAVYLDGVKIGQSADFPIDDLLSPNFLEGVEVYTGIGGAPVEYSDSNCGVILFWSRSAREGRPFSWKRLLAGVAAAGLMIFIAK